MIEAKTTELDPQAALQEDLLRLRGFLERSDIEGARAFVKELEQHWPDSEKVRHYARVLAPPTAKTLPGVQGRPRDQEFAWLREHSREHPGCWLAVLEDRLLAANKELRIVLATIRQCPDAEGALLFFQMEHLSATL